MRFITLILDNLPLTVDEKLIAISAVSTERAWQKQTLTCLGISPPLDGWKKRSKKK